MLRSRSKAKSPPAEGAIGHPAQGIALAEALVPRPAEHRMIRYPVLDAELAKPPISQIDLHLGAQPLLNGIAVREPPQSEFCNTIGDKAAATGVSPPPRQLMTQLVGSAP